MAEDYKNTPGLLMYLLGNENNYGLFWQGPNGRYTNGAKKINHSGKSNV